MMSPRLHAVPPSEPPFRPPSGSASDADLGLLAFLVGIHVALLAGFSAGFGFGASAAGYATAVVFVGSRELLRELRARLARRGSASR